MFGCCTKNVRFCIENAGFCVETAGFCIENAGFCIENAGFCRGIQGMTTVTLRSPETMSGFIAKLHATPVKMMNFAVKMMNSVLTMMTHALKAGGAWTNRGSYCNWYIQRCSLGVSNKDEFCIKHEKLCIKHEECCV